MQSPNIPLIKPIPRPQQTTIHPLRRSNPSPIDLVARQLRARARVVHAHATGTATGAMRNAAEVDGIELVDELSQDVGLPGGEGFVAERGDAVVELEEVLCE